MVRMLAAIDIDLATRKRLEVLVNPSGQATNAPICAWSGGYMNGALFKGSERIPRICCTKFGSSG